MRLDEFVKQTLTSLVQGVQSAQESVAALGGKVNPYRAGSGGSIQVVEFDVEVSTGEATATKGGIGVFVGAVGVGSQGQSQENQTSVGRVRFKVPVELPSGDGG